MRLIKKLNAKLDSNLILFHKKRLDEIITNYFKLRNQLPFVSDEGTEITLNNTIENPMLSFNIKGNSIQETTEGYNIMNFDVEGQNSNVTVNDDGTITINGKGGFSLKMKEITLEANQTYRQKIEIVSGNVEDNIFNALLSFKSNVWLTPTTYVEYTPTENETKSTIWLNASKTFNNCRLRIWGYKGTDDKPFEKATDGASPNPSYPKPIYSAGDNGSITEKIVNKNWFNKETTTSQVGYFTPTGELKSGGNSTVTTSYTQILPNTNMYLSGVSLENVCYYDENFNFIERVTTASAKINKNARYIRFQVATSNFNLDNVQLELGSSASTYVAHQEQTYTIPVQQPMRSIGTVKDSFVKVNEHWFERHLPFIESYNGEELPEDVYTRKNLFKTWTNGQYTSKGITFTWNSDGTLTLNGTATDTLQINYNNIQTIEGLNKRSSIRKINGVITEGSITFIHYTSNYQGTKQCSVDKDRTLSSTDLYNLAYSIFRIQVSNGAILDNVTIALQIEEGSEATEWVPYSTKYCNDKSMSTTGQFSTGASVQYVDETNWNMLPCTKEQIAILEKLPETYSGQTNIYSLDETPAYIEASGIYDTKDLVTRVEVLESLA